MTLTQAEAAGGTITARGPLPGFGDRLRRGRRTTLGVLAQAITVFLIATFLTFALGAWSGSNPAAVALGEFATPEDIARLNAYYGLDRPFFVRYFDWLGAALTGDFGESWFTGIPVSLSIWQAFPISLSIAVGATLVAIVVGAGSGILAAVTRGSWVDRLVTGWCAVLATVPAFVAGIALILLFAFVIPIFPVGGYVAPDVNLGAWFACLVLPSVALSLDASADLSRQLRTTLVGSLAQNYVVGATVHGLGRPRIVLGHALPNALGPAVATLGLHVPRLVGGAVITEAVFGMPGLGMLARQGALSGDVPIVQGVLLVSIVLVVLSGVIVGFVLSRIGGGERSLA
jgi:peptide/nickel transport system permease protein